MYIFTLIRHFLAFKNDQAVMKRIADDDNFSFHKCMFGLQICMYSFFSILCNCMFRDFILLKPDPPDENQAGLQVVSGLTLDPEVSTMSNC